MVVIRPCRMPRASLSTLAIGPRQLVVQEAQEITVWEPSSLESLTPSTTVRSSPLAGAEMITFLAPPSSMCLRASAALVKKPVDSSTTSTPKSPHGSAPGSRSASALMVLPPTAMPSSVTCTSSLSLPSTLSYFSRCAMVLMSPRSLKATTSTSWPPDCTARQKFRPMRRNPLIPTRTVTFPLPHTSISRPRAGQPSRPAQLGATLSAGYHWAGPPGGGPAGVFVTRMDIHQGPATVPGTSRLEHVGGDRRLGVGHSEFLSSSVGHRQQPADPARHRILGHRRVGELAQLLQRRLPVLQPQPASSEQMSRGVVGEQLQGSADPRRRSHRRAGGSAQVGVIEVGQSVGGGAYFTAHPAFFPGQYRVVRTEPGEQRADGVAVTDHHSIGAPDLARLGLDAQPAGGPHEGQRRLRARAGHFQCSRAARLGERSVRQKRTAPRRLGIAEATGDDLRGQSPGEAQQGGALGPPAARLGHPQPTQLVLDGGGHGHRRFSSRCSCDVMSRSPGLSADLSIRRSAAASATGSWRSADPSSATRSRYACPPSASAQRCNRAGTATVSMSARTACTVNPDGAWPDNTVKCCSGENPAVSPGCGTRLSTTIRRATVPPSASARSGTSRCGSTLVNHEPGPSTTTSASATARTASAQACGRCGRSHTRCTRPGVAATATWPRIRRTASESPSRPATSASMSSGSAAIGNTRPVTPSSWQASSNAATGSPHTSSSPASTRLPTACPASAPLPPKRCWNTCRQRAPPPSPAASAVSAIRKSPGGSSPHSRRSRPDEPPSSAPVTTAVTSSVIARRANNVAYRPWPPPSATAFSGRFTRVPRPGAPP